MEQKETLKSMKVIDLVQISLMAAMAYVATAFINIPIGNKAVLHLGDTIVFISAIMLGKKKAFIASAIGMCLFDLLSPYAMWAPYTFVIKGVMAYIAGAVAYRSIYNGEKTWNNILGFVLGGIWMIIGYYLAGSIIYGSFIVAIADIPGNITQVVAGIVIATPLLKALKKVKLK